MKRLSCFLLVLPLTVPTLALGEGEAKKAIYDEKADAKAQIADAVARARRENRRVLIQWGGNWCSWCLLLHDCFQSDANLAQTLRNDYDVVLIDINRNRDLAGTYGAVPRGSGVPFLTILDSAGKVLINQPTEPFETKKEGKNGHDPRKLREFLTEHRAPAQKAEEVLETALAEAARSERNVLLHFGAPSCGWCLRLDAWLASEPVAGILARDFLDVKIDLDRTKGSKEVLTRYNPSGKGGIPWFVMLDAKGNAIVTSDGPKGNIGFPAADHEIEYFVTMLEKAKQRITTREIEQLRRSLEEAEQRRKVDKR